jgi:hypothetical protein
MLSSLLPRIWLAGIDGLPTKSVLLMSLSQICPIGDRFDSGGKT